jgi:aconitate hydratase
MGFTFAEKLRESHLVEGQTAPGREIGIRVGQTLTQDATGTMVYLPFEAIGINRVKTQLSASFTDHNILETDSKNVDDHRYLHTTAARFGAVLSPAGNAISTTCTGKVRAPWEDLLGSDSHSTAGGCLGMIAIGAGGLEAALALAERPFHFAMPRTWDIHLTGRLQPWH